MDSLAIILVLVSALLHALKNLFTKSKDLIRTVWVANKKTILANGMFGISGYLLILIAFTIEKVSYIVALRQLSIVFAVLMGSHLLKEKYPAIRLMGATLIFAGACFISVAK